MKEILKETENYNTFLEFMNQELAMYDDLAKNEKLKKDRELARDKYLLLEEVKNKFKRINN